MGKDIKRGDAGSRILISNGGLNMWQNIAFVLIGLGILALIGWSVEGFFTASDIPLLIRIAVGAVGVGVLILIIVAVRDRIVKAKDEDFKGVER